MSKKTNISSNGIIDFINSVKDKYTNEIEAEIDELFRTLVSSEQCSFRLTIPSSIYEVFGVSGIINYIDYTYLIPNLFRLCYLETSFNIPNICVNYVGTSTVSYYYPNLLSDKYIKSFLYYNVSASYKHAESLNKMIISVINLENYVNTKKRNITYGSVTPSTVIFNNIYSNNSMLRQLLLFNSFINLVNNNTYTDKVLKPFTVLWDYTTGCVNKSVKKYTVGVYNSNNIIDLSTIKILNHLRYSSFNNFDTTDVNYNTITRVLKSNIFRILDLALEVQRDINEQINYYLSSKTYCLKDYMQIKNIPFLIKLYKNFYKNQIETIQNYIPYVTVNEITPVTISLTTYINEFTSYFNGYLGKILKTIKISTTEAIILAINSTTNIAPAVITRENYIYYYLNTANPSPVQLYNFWGTTEPTPDYTGKTVLQFENDFMNVGTSVNYSYLYTSQSVAVQQEASFSNDGLYPLYTTPTAIAYIYYTFNDLAKTKLKNRAQFIIDAEKAILKTE